MAHRPWHRLARGLGSWGIALLVATAALAQRDLKDIPDADPELERKTFVVPDGFEVNLYAADPLLAKPIQMNFDERGRLWVASSSIYPQVKPGERADDKILILEDANGDGKADKTSVFSGGLLIPTGVAPGDGGAYVANSTELLHLSDTDGDGKADRERVVLSGFGTEDTHHILHTLRWGPDGMLYMNQSIYIHSHIETPYGPRRLDAGGIWQFRPDTARLEVYCRGFVNPWGHHFDRWGQSFATDGAYGEGINYAFPGATFVTAKDAPRVLRGLNAGSPKHCGLEIVSGRHLPESWQGNMLTNDFRAHRVCRFVVTEDRSGFASREEVEVIRSTHPAFRPIDVKMGPDGAIYIADWYNPIIQHGEVDFRDPRRDRVHGRIWRVTAKGRPLVVPPKLAGAKVEELLAALKLPEEWTRSQAKRLLRERGESKVLPALRRWIGSLDRNDADYEHHRLEGLWTYQSVNVIEPKLLASLLRSPEARVRAAATRVVYYWHDRLTSPLALLEPQVHDSHPRVRLEAVRALAQVRDVRAAEIAVAAIDESMDEWLDFAVWQTMRDLNDVWLPAVQAGKSNFGGNGRHLAFALKAVDSPQIVAPILALLASGNAPKENEESLLVLVASLGGPGDLRRMFDMAIAPRTAPERRVKLLDAIAKAARERKTVPQGDLNAVVALLGDRTPAVQAATARACGAMKIAAANDKLLALARDQATPAELRRAAFDGLATIAPVETLRQMAAEGATTEIRRDAVVALAARDVTSAAAAAMPLFAAPAAADADAALHESLFAALIGRSGGPSALAGALAGRKVPTDVAKIGLRVVDAAGRPEPELAAALRAAGGLGAGPKAYSADELKSLAANVAKLGDAARGERVFRDKRNNCQKCHAIAAAGGSVGPDLVSLGASAPIDYIVESLLDPSKKIKENYHSLVVQTDDGQVISGIKLRETPTHLILRDAEDREISIPFETIDARKDGGSLMPAGAVENLTRAELLDLARFLSELGKQGAYAVGKAPVVRRWETLQPSAQSRELLSDDGLAAAATNDKLSWEPVYSTVSGVLPLDTLAQHEIRQGQGRYAIVRFSVEVKNPGPTKLSWNDPAAIQLWVDGKSTIIAPTQSLDLAAGKHTLTLAIDAAKRTAPIRCTFGE